MLKPTMNAGLQSEMFERTTSCMVTQQTAIAVSCSRGKVIRQDKLCAQYMPHCQL